MFTFELPEIGEGVIEGEIVRWLVAEGERISADQPLCEVMTDKATVEISSPKGGRIARLFGAVGDVIKVHSPLAEIELGGAAAQASAPPPAPSATPAAVTPSAVTPSAATPAVLPPAPEPALEPATGTKTLATPAVRAHARQQGVHIDAVRGSGPAGRVTRADIDAYSASPVAAAAVAPPALRAPPATTEGDQRVRIVGLRRKIAEKMVESYRTIPHFTYVDEVDATALVDLRASLAARAREQGVKLSYMPFIMKALVRVFRDFPTVNATMDEAANELVLRARVHIGIATDTPAGLYVPVVKNVEQKSILELAREVHDLTERTRAGKAALDELTGGTFTITSVGNIGGRFATPIINHPEVAILGVNQIHDRPVVRNGEIVARKMMYLSPSFDHRVIDGAVGARFVAALKGYLEQPEALLLELR